MINKEKSENTKGAKKIRKNNLGDKELERVRGGSDIDYDIEIDDDFLYVYSDDAKELKRKIELKSTWQRFYGSLYVMCVLDDRIITGMYNVDYDITKILSWKIEDDYYNFPYETNKMFTIEKHDISFAVGQRNKERYLFISKVADGLFEGDTSPYRTFYKGLMKEPFTLVYPLEDKTKIHITQNKVIEISLQ